VTGANPMVGGDSTGLKQNRSCKTNKRQKDRKQFLGKTFLPNWSRKTNQGQKETNQRQKDKKRFFGETFLRGQLVYSVKRLNGPQAKLVVQNKQATERQKTFFWQNLLA
jgi:hypothetical protein